MEEIGIYQFLAYLYTAIVEIKHIQCRSKKELNGNLMHGQKLDQARLVFYKSTKKLSDHNFLH